MRYDLKRWVVLAMALVPFSVMAQKDANKYRAESEVMRKEVWSWNKPEFQVRTIPAEYANASSVIIARHHEVVADSKKKSYFATGSVGGPYRELTLTDIVREVVKVNDKAALSSYSELSFTQLGRKAGLLSGAFLSTFVGAKVIKPDGSTKEINADDIVLTKDEKNEKEAKLAIPDLQVGDIVDYFIAKQLKLEYSMTLPPYTFTFFDTDPVLYSSIHCEFGKKYAIEYRTYNGAPDFKQKKGADGEIILDAEKRNMPPVTGFGLWTSPYRQLPIIRMNLMMGYNGMFAGRFNTRMPGEVYKNQDPDEFIEDAKRSIATQKMNMAKNGGLTIWNETVDDYFKALKKNRKNITPDSLLAEMYYLYRFEHFMGFLYNTAMDKLVNMGRLDKDNNKFMFYLGMFLNKGDIDNKLVISTSKYGPDMKGIMSQGDMGFLLLAESAKPRVIGFENVFSPAFYVPPYYEGTKQAVTLDLGGPRAFHPKEYEKGSVSIPYSTAEDNLHSEQLRITPLLDKAALQVKRTTSLKGHYKHDVQQALILFEDFYESERKILGQKESLVEYYEEDRKTRKYGTELRAAFAEARKKHKESFLQEAKEEFEQEITDMDQFKVDNLGVRHTAPDFIYSSQFKMGGVVKKAGNNFIIEVGKLQGRQLKVEEDQRQRSTDIYAPFARSLHYQITLDIPEGYTAEGVSSLNKKVENHTGSFTAEATNDGKTITIIVKKVYKNAFEPSSNWAGLLAFIDAANEWSNAKVLLKKK